MQYSLYVLSSAATMTKHGHKTLFKKMIPFDISRLVCLSEDLIQHFHNRLLTCSGRPVEGEGQQRSQSGPHGARAGCDQRVLPAGLGTPGAMQARRSSCNMTHVTFTFPRIALALGLHGADRGIS